MRCRSSGRPVKRFNAIPGISWLAPDGLFCPCVNCSGLIGRTTPRGKVLNDDAEVALYLLEDAGVAVVAGSAYGLSPYFRMLIAASIEIIAEGCRKIAEVVAALE